MFLLIQLIILFLCSFINAEYVLYKYDGTELTEQEHRTAYQILLEQQWPTAPAFNQNYNPEIDEEIEIAKRLKLELPTVYAQWIPKIVYENMIYSICKVYNQDLKSLLDDLEKKTIKTSLLYNINYEKPLFDGTFIFRNKEISCLQEKLNQDEFIIRFHQIINTALSSSSMLRSFSSNQAMFDHYSAMFQDFEYRDVFLRILKLELLFKKQPNMFLIWRAGSFLKERDFSMKQLKTLEANLRAVDAKKHVNIDSLHLYNMSYGSSFLAARKTDYGASCFHYYNQSSQYGYALPLKKTDILSGAQFFGIPPLTTLINTFFCHGELFHPRAYTLITDDLTVRQEIENAIYGDAIYVLEYDFFCENSETPYHSFITDPIAKQIMYQLASGSEVIKQAVLRRRYIVKNAIPLNDATQDLIENARQIYK